MVAPDLDIPGKIAIIWAIPIIKASFGPTVFVPVFALSAKNKIPAVTNNKALTRNICPSKSLSISSSKNKPTNTAGIIDRIIFRANKCDSVIRGLNKPERIIPISFLNTTIVASAVAACNVTVIKRPEFKSFLSPKKYCAISR